MRWYERVLLYGPFRARRESAKAREAMPEEGMREQTMSRAVPEAKQLAASTLLFDPQTSYSSLRVVTYYSAAQLYSSNVYLHRAVDLIAHAVSSVPFIVIDRSGTVLVDHPASTLLRTPNPREDMTALLYRFIHYLLLSGNGYLVALPAGEQPSELYTLRPDRVAVQVSRSEPVAYRYQPGPAGAASPSGVQGAEPGEGSSGSSGGNVQAALYPAESVLHMRMFHPLNDWYGLSPVAVAALAVEAMNQGDEWNLALLDNSGRPSGALVAQGLLSDMAYEALRERLREAYTGARNAGRPILLEGGLDWKPMSLSPSDLDWLQGKQQLARDIALALGVPSILLADPAKTTYNNWSEARAAFYEDTILPLASRLTALLSQFFRQYWPDVTVDYNRAAISAIQESEDARNNRTIAAWQAGLMTLNEARRQLGLDALPEGDVLLKPQSMQYVPPDEIQSDSTNFPLPPSFVANMQAAQVLHPGSQQQDGQSPPRDVSEQRREQSVRPAQADHTSQTEQGQGQHQEQTQGHDQGQGQGQDQGQRRERSKPAKGDLEIVEEQVKQVEASTGWNVPVSLIARHERLLKARLLTLFKAAVSRVGQDLLTAHPDSIKSREDIAHLVQESHGVKALEERLGKTLTDLTKGIFHDVGRVTLSMLLRDGHAEQGARKASDHQDTEEAESLAAAFEAALRQGKLTVSDNDPLLAQFLAAALPLAEGYAKRYLPDIADTVKSVLIETIAHDIESGASILQMAQHLSAATKLAYSRAEVIARTHTIAASNIASLAALKQTGRAHRYEKVWLATEDERTRFTHMGANGQAVPVDGEFEVGGYRAKFPGDPDLPAQEAVNCRCTVVYRLIPLEQIPTDGAAL